MVKTAMVKTKVEKKVKGKTKKAVVKKLVAPVFGLDGASKAGLALPKELFGVKKKPLLIAQALRVFLSNQRTARAKTKTRGEISGSNRKIWKQKGTGRARHGDRYAPIFVGGSKAHGPRGTQNYYMTMNKKMKQAAFVSLLSSKLVDDRLLVIDGLKGIDGKTKSAEILIKKILSDHLGNSLYKKKGNLLIFPNDWTKATRSFKNLPYCRWASAETLNIHDLASCHFLILTPEAVKTLTTRNSTSKPTKETDNGK
ncbi:MAG: 50S ribosomal protein L4 [Patescibacteria group bacterium]